jgi:hypothetical protein
LKDYQLRVIEESYELAGKIDRLSVFLESPNLRDIVGESVEVDRMRAQLSVMAKYAAILNERIQFFR